MSFNAQQIEQQAAQFLNQGRVEDALKSYKTLLKKDPKSRRLRKTVADLSLKLGNKREAEQYMLAIAETDVKEKQYRMAIPIYRELIKMRPKDHEMHLEIAHCLIESNFETDAVIHLKKAVEMTQRQKPEVAQEIQHRIVTMNPGEMNERRTYAELLEAASWSDKASDAWKDFAALNRKLGKVKEAARSIERALSNREHWETRLEAAQCRFESNEPRKALEHLQKVYKDFPTDPKVLALLATGLQMVGHEAKAKQLWLEAGKRYEDAVKKAAAFAEAQICGASESELPDDFATIQRLSNAQQLLLHKRDWSVAASKVEQRFVLKTNLYLEFSRFAAALECIRTAEGLEKRPAIFALLVEALVVNDAVDEAIELLKGFKNSNPQIMEDVQLRLLGLGLTEEDSEELIDDDLLDDDLEDISEDDFDSVDDESSSAEFSETPADSSNNNVEMLLNQASQLHLNGRGHEALSLLNQVLEVDPTHMGALEKMAAWALEQDSMPNSTTTSIASDPFEVSTSAPFAGTDPFASVSTAADPFAVASDTNAADDPFASDFGSSSFVAPNVEEESAGEMILEANLLMRPQLQHTYKLLLVGFVDQAVEELRSINTLEAIIVLSRLRIAKEEYRGALEDLQDALDTASPNDSAYVLALWEVARIYSLQQRVRNTKRTLDEIVELNPSFKGNEIALWREALNLLD